MDEKQRRLDEIRRERSELENHVIDSYAAGKISRREFVRRGTVIGMSIPLLGFLASACGGDDGGEAAPPAEPTPAESAPPPAETGTPAEPAAPPAQAGGALRTGIIAPAIELNPLVVYDEGGLAVLGQSGEYLIWTNEALELEPRLAESWEPNADGSVWTFKIRQGVTFHDGKPLTAKDVAYTLNLHADPDNKWQRSLGVRGSRRALGRRRRRPSTTPRSRSRSTARTAASPTSSRRTTTTSSSFPTASTRQRGSRASSGRARGFSTRSRPSRESRTRRTRTTGTRPASRSRTRASSSSMPRTRRGSSRSRAARSTS